MGLRPWDVRITNWPASLVSFPQLVGFIVAFSSAYEVVYNFNFWSATCAVAALRLHTSITDLLNGSYPVPWNYIFATRVFAAPCVISWHSVCFLRRLNRSRVI